MRHRAECPECSWTGDASTLSGAAREADEHRQETGHDATVERDLSTDGGIETSEGEDPHGDRAIYCEVAERYLLGRTPDGECPFCGSDLTGERYERLQEFVSKDAETEADIENIS